MVGQQAKRVTIDLGGRAEVDRRVELYVTRADGEDLDVPALRQIAEP